MPFYIENPNNNIRHPLQSDINDLPEIPADLALILYGSTAANLALDALHVEKVDPIFQRRFDAMLDQADLDVALYPTDNALTRFHDHGALNIFHALERKLKPGGEITVPTYPPTRLPPPYLQFKTKYKDQDIDVTLQRTPLERFLLMSTQVFFDLQNNRFIFKDEACYKAFLRRVIFIPDLASIIEEAKQVPTKNTKDPRFTRLKTVLKNIIKMRYIGWSLAQTSRSIIEQAFTDQDFRLKVEAAVKDSPEKFKYITEFKHDLPPSSQFLDLFLTPSSIEEKPYLSYDAWHSAQTILDNIEWLWGKPFLDDLEKVEIAQSYCDAFFSDKERSREEKAALAKNLRRGIKVPRRWREADSTSAQNSIMLSNIPAQTTKPTLFNYGHTYFQNKCPPSAVAPDMGHIEIIIPSRIEREFIDEYSASIQRLITYLATIGCIYKVYQFIADRLELDDTIPQPYAMIFFLASFIVCELLSRGLYQLTQKRHKLTLIITESIHVNCSLPHQDDANNQKIIANLCYLMKMIRLCNPSKEELARLISYSRDPKAQALSPELTLKNIQAIRAFAADQENTYKAILQSILMLLHITGLEPKAVFKRDITAACKEQMPNSQKIIADISESITKDYEKILKFVAADNRPDTHLHQLLSRIAIQIAKLNMLSPNDLPECCNNLTAIKEFLNQKIEALQEQPGELYLILCDPYAYLKEDEKSRKALAENLHAMASNYCRTVKQKM